MAGVTNEGFVAKSLEQITNDINTSMISKFGQNFDVSPESPDGQIIGVFARMLYETWQQMEAAYDAYCPSNAFGLGLDKLCELNGVTRIKNQPTTVAITFSGTAGTIIPKGYVVKTDDDLEFVTIVEAVIPTVVTAECKTEGAIYIAANEVNVLTDAIAGLSSATNLEPGITGIVAEEDPALRNRRETLVINSGTSSIEAIYSAVRSLNLPYITILENYSSTIVDGIPPHSFITVVEGGTPEEISRIIFDNKPLGVQAFGDIVTQVYDYKGFPHSIGISRPIPIDVAGQDEQKRQILENILRIENRGFGKVNENAVSPMGAVGPFQFMPTTAKNLGVNNRRDFRESAEGASRYIDEVRNRLGENFSSAAMYADYNAGPKASGPISRGEDVNLPQETIDYLAMAKALEGGS